MPVEEVVFKGEFIATANKTLQESSEDAKTRFYQLKIDQIFASSALSKHYLFSEILLIERYVDIKCP